MTNDEAQATVARLVPQRTAAAAFHTRKVLFAMARHELEADFVGESAEGSIGIIVGQPGAGRYVLVECFDDGEIVTGVCLTGTAIPTTGT